jgi:hypothetical protein
MPAGPLSISFLREMGAWAMRLAVAAAVVGAAFTRDWRFPVSLAIGATVDIATLELAVKRAVAAGTTGLAAESHVTPVLVAGRLLVKGLLLLAAVLLPAFLNLLGMVIGVLILDVTIMTVGSVKAAASIQR